MLDTAWRQLRYGAALLTGRRIRVDDLRHLCADLVATGHEFGSVDTATIRRIQGAALDPADRRPLDARRWAATVRRAYDETVYYRELLDRLGVAPEDLVLDRATELPPTPKAALRACPELFVARTARPVFQAWTTGTTGTPTAFWFSRYELELGAALSGMGYQVNVGLDDTDVFDICISSRATLGILTTMESCRLIGAVCLLTGLVDPGETLTRLATPVHLPGKKPYVSVISVYPSYLAAIVDRAARDGYRAEDFGLERIVCGGEILTDSLRLRAEKAFGATVIETYAMTETYPVAGVACTEGHLHIGPDQGLVEVLDPDTYEPTPPGEVGMLVVTPYTPYRETMPVLRLATGDHVRRLVGPPECELAGVPATGRVLGRGGEAVWQRDVLDLLEGEPSVPLPAWYALSGRDLHVDADEGAGDRLAAAADALGLTVHIGRVPRPQFHRAMLRETTVAHTAEGGGAWSLR